MLETRRHGKIKLFEKRLTRLDPSRLELEEVSQRILCTKKFRSSRDYVKYKFMSPKEILYELEKEGKYVFHGSEHKLEFLEPRQAYTIIKKKKVKDDVPAIHASPVADIAIFMALINKKNCPKGFRSGFDYNSQDKKIVFTATQKTLDQLKNAKGFVHVFDSNSFKTRNTIESISYNMVKSIRTIEVNEGDLPKDIEIIKEV